MSTQDEDEGWTVDAALTLGFGVTAALAFSTWMIYRIDRAEQTEREPPSVLFRPRFEPYRPSRTYPPPSSRDFASPSERIYREDY